MLDSQYSTQQSSEPNSTSGNASKSERGKASSPRGSFVVAPLPISSPALGTGIVPVFGYIFPFRKDDKVSPPSVVGMAGLAINNGSRAFGAYADLFLREDTFRITALYARGNLDYDLYDIGLPAGNAGRKSPLEQAGQVFRSELLRGVGWDFFLGVRFWTGGSDIVPRVTSDTTTQPEPPRDIGLKTALRALGVRLNRETAPNRFYPTSGTLLDFTFDFFLRA